MGELVALFAMVTLPFALPVAAGANVTFSVTVPVGPTIDPAEMPLALKTGPETVTSDTMILALPELLELVKVS